MAKNICSRPHPKYFTAKEIAAELSCSDKHIYQIIKNPEMREATIKIGKSGVRINKEKFYDLLEKIYR